MTAKKSQKLMKALNRERGEREGIGVMKREKREEVIGKEKSRGKR